MSGCEATPEVKKIIRAMAKNRVDAGVKDAADLIDSIHEEIHAHTPLWKSEIADIIAGIGEVRKQTKSEMQTRLEAIKAELRTKQVSSEKAIPPTPEQAKVTARQNALKKEIDDLNQRIAARDTSKPDKFSVESPEITALKQQRDALKGKLELMEPSPPATRPVDPNEAKNKAAQTAMKNQIDALTKRIDARDMSKPDKPSPKWTEETQAIRAQRDKLAQRYADMGKSDRQENTARSRLQKQIDEVNARIAAGDTGPRAKKATVDTAEVTALRQRLAKAKDDLDAITPKEAKPEPPPKKSPEEVRNATRRADLTKQMADLQHKLDTGDFSKPVKAKPQYDEGTLELQSQRDALRAKADKAIRTLERNNQSLPARLADRLLAFRRAIILSSFHTLGKLTSAATLRTLSTPLEEGVGSVLRQIPGIRSIADMAPREGAGLSLRAEAQAARKTFSAATLKEMYKTAVHGAGTNDVLYGKDKDHHYKLMDLVGQVHGALKTPAKRNEFYRSVELRGAALRKQLTAEGKSPAEVDKQMQSPATQAMLGAKAYEDSQRAIFMNDNAAVTAYRMMIGHLNRSGGAGKAAGKTLEYILPIVKIPTNFVAEAGSYAGGGAKALGQLIASKGLKNLTPDQADYIMRNLKKQTIGAALLAMGYYGANQVGGYYQPGDKQQKDAPEPGGMKLFGVNIPKYLVHNPALEMLQMGATVRHIVESKKKGEGTAGAGMFAAAKGLVGEVPFFDAPGRIAEGLKDYSSASKFAGEQVRDAVLPPDLQHYAKASDPEKVFKRKPEGFVDAIKTGVPGLREQVPLSSYKTLSLDQRMDAVKEMTNPVARETMMKHVMDSVRRNENKLTPAQHDRLESLLSAGS